MNAPELQRRSGRREDGIPQVLVNILIQHGYLDVVWHHGFAGDWNCASAWAEAAAARGGADAGAALDLLARFAGSGRPAVVEQTARVLVAAGRAEEALALARTHAGKTVTDRTGAGGANGDGGGIGTGGTGGSTADLEQYPAAERAGLRLLADLLIAQGRRAEAFELLQPYARHWSVTHTWVAAAEGLGRDAEVADLLAAMVAGSPGANGAKVGDLAEVLIRSGRAGEAEALLRPRLISDDLVHLSLIRQLVDLLLAQGREDAVRELIGGPAERHAAGYYAELLEARGDRDAALATLAPFATADHQRQRDYGELLLRASRLTEATDVLVALDDGFLPGIGLRVLCRALAEQGEHGQALALIDDVAIRNAGMTFALLKLRATVLAWQGDVDQAVAELTAHPQGASVAAALHVAELLAGAGRREEAEAVLVPHSADPMASLERAKLLIALGRADEGIAVALKRTPKRPA
jgi:thioredoxin-like negative regulator of GroEL